MKAVIMKIKKWFKKINWLKLVDWGNKIGRNQDVIFLYPFTVLFIDMLIAGQFIPDLIFLGIWLFILYFGYLRDDKE